jgi:2-polyprenyl-3-methyl-5-hydroxy-6-metoxy-1,4-benzoquinol methylase
MSFNLVYSYPCINCNFKEFINVYKEEKKVQLKNGENLNFLQQLQCCFNCGLIRQEDNKSYSNANLQKYYAQTFRTPVQLNTINEQDKRILNAQKRLSFIQELNLSHSKQLLEIGLGDGVFLSRAHQKFKCSGIDPSLGYDYVKNYLRKLDIVIYDLSLEEFKSNKKFDILCCFLVLEHIKEPYQFVQNMKKLLNEDGVIIIEVPDVDTYSSSNSDSLLTHEHVYHYNIDTLNYLMFNNGLELIAYDNKNVSYGFSLIAAYKINNKPIFSSTKSSFSILFGFQSFLRKHNNYIPKMSKIVTDILLESKKQNKKVGVFGIGYLFNRFVESTNFSYHFDYLFDETDQKIGNEILGVKIEPLLQINTKTDIGYIIIFSEMFFQEMSDKIDLCYKDHQLEIIDIHNKVLN